MVDTGALASRARKHSHLDYDRRAPARANEGLIVTHASSNRSRFFAQIGDQVVVELLHELRLSLDSRARTRITAAHWPNMWRLAYQDGRLSGMVNLTRARDARHGRRYPRVRVSREMVGL